MSAPSHATDPPRAAPRMGPLVLLACLTGAGCRPDVASEAPSPGTASILRPRSDGGLVTPSPADEIQRLFAHAYHLDAILGRTTEAEALYRQILARGASDLRETGLAQLRIATLCRARGDRRCAMTALDWLITHASHHPTLARTAEHEMVELLHPQAGAASALTRGPPVSFTRLQQVPSEMVRLFRDAEQELLRYLRVPLAPQLHNVDAVVAHKRGALLKAVRAYDVLVRSKYQNAVAAGLFRQGSLHQDFAEALGRLRLPDELLARVASGLRLKFHAESVTHLSTALELYRRAAAVSDVAAERWRQAAAQAETQLGRFARRQPGPRP